MDRKIGESIPTSIQIKKGLPTLEDCTIVIPTFNRPSHLRRLLRYYEGIDVRLSILVADSSPDDVKVVNRECISAFKNMDYLHYIAYNPSIHPMKKLNDAVRQVSTPFVVYCGDDDFLIPSGILAAMEFMYSNLDYNVAEGLYYSFQETSSKKILFGKNSLYTSIVIDGAIAKTRLLQYAKSYGPPLFYAVYKTPFIQQINAYALESGLIPDEINIDPFNYCLVILEMLTAIYTRTANLPVLYSLRNFSAVGESDFGHRLDLDERIHASQDMYPLLRSSLASHLSTVSGIDLDDAIAYIDLVLIQYFAPHNLNQSHNQIMEKAGSVLSHYRIGNLIRQYYQRFFGNRYRVWCMNRSYHTSYPGNPTTDSQEYLNYSRIVEAILHNS